MPLSRDIEAEIYFLTTEEGGRTGYAAQGYRPFINYEGKNWITSLSYPKVEVASPGNTVTAYVSFLSPKEHIGKISVGSTFTLIEGPKTVAKGVVTKIIDLEQSAARAHAN